MTSSDGRRSAFDLPGRLHAKAAAELIAADDEQFARIREVLGAEILDTRARLGAARARRAGTGQSAVERDLDVRRLSARLRLLERSGADACLGSMTPVDGAPVYIGRFGLSEPDGRRLLVDWRAPAAEPFFAATHADPRGLAARRRYRWADGRVIDYWDEVFADDGIDHSAALDDQSAFIASLGESRSPRMRDVLATIHADQDAIIRAGSDQALVVDGGPGTGKTVVALHRAAYLLYADPRLRARGGVLVVGPHRPYLAYIDDVLPGLGEEGVLACTLGDLVPGAEGAPPETDPEIARLKADGRFAEAVESAVRLWERLPSRPIVLDTPWGEVPVLPRDWTEAFADADTLPHDDVRNQAWNTLVDLLTERVEQTRDAPASAADPWSEGWGDTGADAGAGDLADPFGDVGTDDGDGGFDAYGAGAQDEGSVRDLVAGLPELREEFDRAWPLLDPDRLLRGLWTDPRLLRRCAPWLDEAQTDLIVAAGERGWTTADLPWRDAVCQRVGDPRAESRGRAARVQSERDRRRMSDVVRDLIAADDSDMQVMSMLRGQDLRGVLDAAPAEERDPLAGPFAHIVVDEAQDLTDAQWGMLLRRCPSRSLTIVGDRAQARRGFTESWRERLTRVGLPDVEVAGLTVNYRTPEEIMAVAAPVILAEIPDANVPTSIRRGGAPVRYGPRADLDAVVEGWIATHEQGTAAVIGDAAYRSQDRVLSLTPESAKGLEFDVVVLVDPERFGAGVAGAVDRYVAMTRATRELVILSS